MIIPVGPELLTNGDFASSAGVGASSVAGPGWMTSYTVPSGGNLFGGAGAGQSTWAYFTTNAGQVTGGWGAANPILAQGARSIAVNVGANVAIPIIEWVNIPLVSGQLYLLQALMAVINFPASVAVRIDGGAQGIFPVVTPVAASIWEQTATSFTFTGPTGNYPVGLYSNTGSAPGNDLAFDNFSLRTAADVPTVRCDCCPIGREGCWRESVRFDTVAQFAAGNPAGWSGPINLAATINGLFNNGEINGYNTSAGRFPPGPSPVVDYGMTVARDNVIGVRLWNQGGGDLSDFDGLGQGVRLAFYDPGDVLIRTMILNGRNGGGAQTSLLDLPVNGVQKVRMSDLKKLTTGTVAPLWQEFQLVLGHPLVSCRTPDGNVHWYREDGTEVLDAVVSIGGCT